MNLNWIAGFITADGNFSLNIKKSPRSALKISVNPSITITQDNLSLIVLNHIVSYLGLGKVYKDSL